MSHPSVRPLLVLLICLSFVISSCVTTREGSFTAYEVEGGRNVVITPMAMQVAFTLHGELAGNKGFMALSPSDQKRLAEEVIEGMSHSRRVWVHLDGIGMQKDRGKELMPTVSATTLMVLALGLGGILGMPVTDFWIQDNSGRLPVFRYLYYPGIEKNVLVAFDDYDAYKLFEVDNDPKHCWKIVEF